MNRNEFILECKSIGISLGDDKLDLLDNYYHILIRENAKYNLTRIVDEKDVYLKHFYDSLTINMLTSISNQVICDMGTGAGFPGIVLAICFPHTNITLIESNGKKCNFLNIVKNELGLSNITIINSRIEDYASTNREVFDIVVSRAVAPLKILLEYGIPLVKVNGSFIAMKANMKDEENNIDNYLIKLNIKEVNRVIFNLPYENSIRTLIEYGKIDKTNNRYPRRYSEMLKKDI